MPKDRVDLKKLQELVDRIDATKKDLSDAQLAASSAAMLADHLTRDLQVMQKEFQTLVNSYL